MKNNKTFKTRFNYKKFGETLRLKRKQEKLTQLELAKKLNISDSAISYIELYNGSIETDMLIILCLWMGVSPMDFLLPKT